MAQIAELVANSAKEKIDLATASLRPEHNYASLPLCIIDAVFSIAARYTVTQATVQRFAESHVPKWPLYNRGVSTEHSVSDFLVATASFSDDELASVVFDNRQRTSTRNGILKAAACRRFAKALQESGIERFDDLSEKRLFNAESAIRRIPGQNRSVDYFKLLAGAQMVKADRMIIRFVANAAGLSIVSPDVAKDATIGAAAILQLEFKHLDVRLLDSEMWAYESRLAANAVRTRRVTPVIQKND